MGTKEVDVICVGAAIIDIPLQPFSKEVFDVDSYPIDKISVTTGGDAINESIILSKLDKKVILMSRIGKDLMGEYILKECERHNVDAGSMVVDDSIDTSINIGLVREDGERTFVTNRNGSMWRMDVQDVNFERFKEAKLLSMASIFNNPLLDNNALLKIFKKAKDSNLITCADIIKSRDGKGLRDIKDALGYLDYFFPNYDEAVDLTGKEDLDEIADVLLDCKIKNVVIKIGKDGCFIKNIKERYIIPTYKKANRIDTTGAGDNFVAGFITALLENKSLEYCGKFANAVASVSVQSLGATTGVENRKQVMDMMKE
ncbi:carbohydrate kinase family protein [Alteribacillus sp. YIM 98480]|uniref:carbohydrate kinase family protein n=1 Tax=Alteribacillus sp. YIM 98480 TaxID=2606599 RepID=UPI00131B4685|nr:carbohydrate kinase family protein [Alteribacillus sp. YIM 98480]